MHVYVTGLDTYIYTEMIRDLFPGITIDETFSSSTDVAIVIGDYYEEGLDDAPHFIYVGDDTSCVPSRLAMARGTSAVESSEMVNILRDIAPTYLQEFV